MDTLPPEILIQILDNIPSPAVKEARLTSRTFNAILSKRTFEVLVSFLDPAVAQSTLTAIAQDPQHRRRRPSIWSPSCIAPPSLPVDEAFLMALWAGLRGNSRAIGMGGNGDKLDVGGWQNGVGRPDVTEEELRLVLFRYALYLSYVNEYEEGHVPHAWVFKALCTA
ncbi:hypothetical protein F66182_7837 [Fusarium sp. NRRL 66182]|nr:hypothetical protein F66182_7837 [Fusarium sp. NRRL 66182]